MILHKECLPITRKWLDKPYCYPFVFPWEICLTDHFGAEELTTATFVLKVQFVDDDGNTTTDITSSFDVALGLDSDNKNVFVAQLREFPVTMPVNFRLMVTITNGTDTIYQQTSEPYVFHNDQCVSAFTVKGGDWGRITGGRLVINGQRYQVDITGTGLPPGLTLLVNSVRGETSIGADTGLVYEIYGEDSTGEEIEFTPVGVVCAGSGNCHTDTVLLEGVFDCLAPDGRYVGSVYPFEAGTPDIRYRYLTRLYADLIEMPSEITRTLSVNNKTQRTERLKKYQLISYAPIPGWQKDEVETIMMGAKIYIQGQEYSFTNGTVVDRQGVPGTTGWWLKADLEQLIERKEFSCEVKCATCPKMTGLSFEIQGVPCDPLISLRATTTANEDGTVRLDITANNTTGATGFKVGYRVQGDPAFTYITPNPMALPVSVDALANAVYEVEVTKITAAGNCEAQTTLSNATDLNPFDYLVVRYIWTDTAGRDLDTFTGFIETGTVYDNDWVGYGQGDPKVPAAAADAMAYLFWASDNTQSGVEAVLMNLKQFVLDNAGVPDEIKVRMNATWFAQRLTGDVQVQLTTYLGGTMSKTGFDFVNTGGVQVDQVTLQANVGTQSTTANIVNSSNVAIVQYNKNTKAATITLV